MVSIFVMAILTTSSMAVQTVTYTSERLPEAVGTWERYHTLPYFDPDLGNLISVDFTASLNATVDGGAENMAPSGGVEDAYISADADMYVDMINGDRLTLQVHLATAPKDLTQYDNTLDYGGTSGFSDSDEGDTWGSIYYDDARKDDYIDEGTFNLKAYATASSTVVGSGNWDSFINTYSWSNASITYTYEDLHCLSGYKIDNCTGQPLSGWTITVNNSTDSWSNDTDADGFWEICNLEDGTYTVCEVLKPGWTQIDPDSCHTATLDGANITDINFTNQQLYCITGYKINSSSGAGLPGWNITLTNASGSVMKQTGPDGRYEFCNLLPGGYSVCEKLEDGWKNITPTCISVPLGCNDSNDNNFTNVPGREKACNTFWANWNGEGTCLIPDCSKNWGWYLKPSIEDLKNGTTSDLWAGAGGCDLSKGYNVGTMDIQLDSAGKNVTLHFNVTGVNDDCDMDGWHLWISDSSLCPLKGFNKWIIGTAEDIQIDLKKVLEDQKGDGVFVAVHGVACCDKCGTNECTFH